jgi:putative PIN family toxin of toxin-antitoxin system
MKIVLDTNVIVSGMLSSDGSAGEIVRLVACGDLTLCYDVRIICEYRDVLCRLKLSFDKMQVEYFLDQTKASGDSVAAKPLSKRLPDRYDEPFLEVALAGGVSYLVTGNIKHYPADRRYGVKIVSPKEFLNIFRKE